MADAVFDASLVVPRGARPEPRKFQRAYKACIPCRKRKSRCDLSADDYSAGRPCARCRRELKDCVFSIGRERRTSVGRTSNEQTNTINDLRHHSQRLSGELDSYSPARQHQSPDLEEAIQPDGPALAQTAAPNLPQMNGLDAPVMRKVVLSGDDALNLLFQAAHQQNDVRENQDGQSNANNTNHSLALDNTHDTPHSTTSRISRGPTATSDVLEIWRVCRFVKMGWFTSEEAVFLVDLFFKNLSPFSPVLTDFYRDHANHYYLVTQEPMLCCTILAISSRYNQLPGSGSVSRGYLIHERLWEHCQHIILRVMLGQEKGSRAQTRTPGTIQALLLVIEWNPRRMHFPPPNDGWDSELLMESIEDREERELNAQKPSRGRWLEDVINPARRSGRMSWMLAGCALSLAHELGILDDTEREKHVALKDDLPREWSRVEQYSRIRRLIYLYMEQLSSRLGFKSMTPQSLSHAVFKSGSTVSLTTSGQHWHLLMGAWIELTRTVKSVSDMLFPSPAFTAEIIRNGRYVSLMDHFQPLLTTWKEKYLRNTDLESHYYDLLCIEYQSARIFINSLGLQAVVERTLAESTGGSISHGTAQNIDATDYGFIQEVVDGSLETLQIAIGLAEKGILMYAPVRIFLRITSASIYLLKGISIGVGATKLRTSLDVLARCIAGLRSNAPDDMHLGSGYATLLEMHVDQLQKRFVPTERPHNFPTRPSSVERAVRPERESYETSMQLDSMSEVDITNAGNMIADVPGLGEEWLTLPFDPSLVPFVAGDTQGFPWLGDGSLDFIWNLET